MRRTLLAVVVGVAIIGCGGSNSPGSSNTSDPVAACKSVFTTLCDKLFQCNQAGAAQVYGTSANCASSLSSGCTSAGTACPSGTSYNAGNSSSCINDYANESCTDVTNSVTPASCSKVCT